MQGTASLTDRHWAFIVARVLNVRHGHTVRTETKPGGSTVGSDVTHLVFRIVPLVALGLVAGLLALKSASSVAHAKPGSYPQAKVKLGIDVLLDDRIDLVKGKRIGLITNASGVDGKLRSTADRLHRDKRVKLVRLFAPEHGIRGAAPAGKTIEDVKDPGTGLPVFSLFGANKQPPEESLADLDALVFDIQDIGSRTYTYTTTMARSMRAARKAKIPFIVLDRPNPLGGEVFEGPMLTKKRFSFVGYGPVPVSHGLTAGELAGYYNVFRNIRCKLVVVKMAGWRRGMTWDDTGLSFVMTSPGIPHARSAHLYIATGMIGGVTKNINEGVGTTLPFELIGAEWIRSDKLLAALQKEKLPGIRFRAVTYRPYYQRHRGRTLHGVQLLPYDWKAFRPLKTALTILTTIERLYPKRMRFRRNFNIIWGDPEIRKAIQSGASAADIERSWLVDTLTYSLLRLPFLLYP